MTLRHPSPELPAPLTAGLPVAASRPAPRWLLVVGLLVGALLAAASLVHQRSSTALPEAAVARVGQRLILRDEWLKAVAAVSSERRSPLTPVEQQQVLDRLIDEELLVQHGLQQGLVEKDQRLRGELVSEVMMSAYGANAEARPDEATLRHYYAANRERYAGTARLQVSATRLNADGVASAFQPPLPRALLTPAKLRNYLGPALTQVALSLPPGGRQRIASGQGAVELTLEAREAAPEQDFDALREQLVADYRRDADEASVRKLIAQLRSQQLVLRSAAVKP